MSEADWQRRFSLHLHVKWPGCDTAEEWKAAGGKNEGRFPGQCYVTSSITDHRPASVYERCCFNLQLNLFLTRSRWHSSFNLTFVVSFNHALDCCC